MAVLSPLGYPNDKGWASDTPNVQSLTDYDQSVGILYRSEIISAQVNGALQLLSNNARWNLYAGGYWTPNATYDIGNYCKMIVKMDTGQYHIQDYAATAQTINVCPIKEGGACVKKVFDSGYTYFECADLDTLKAEVNTGWVAIDYYSSYIQALIEQFRNDLYAEMQKVKDQLTPTWHNFGSIQGGSWDLNLAVENDSKNMFMVTLTANVAFRNVLLTGATEKTGLLVIVNGGKFLTSFFSDKNAIFTFDVPFPVFPNNTNNGAQWLAIPYYYSPQVGKVFFTRV